ncbi:MAG TPA: hypothetical protein VKA48_09625 [Gammaproteobacteria bacterium]|nr:hypothetical protein [Gammaproteobacteria bacterium]
MNDFQLPEDLLREVYSRYVEDDKGESWFATVTAYHVPSQALGLVTVTGGIIQSGEDLSAKYQSQPLHPATREEVIERAIELVNQISTKEAPQPASRRPKTEPKKPAKEAQKQDSKPAQPKPDPGYAFVPEHMLDPFSPGALRKRMAQVKNSDLFAKDQTWRGQYVNSLELGPYPRGQLSRAKIYRLGQLEGLSERDLQVLRGIGPETSRAIVQAINKFLGFERHGKKVAMASDNNGKELF